MAPADQTDHVHTDTPTAAPLTSRKDAVTMTEDHRTHESVESPEQPVDTKQAVMDGLGGVSGMVYTALPVVAFAMAVPFLSLPAAIGAAIAIAAGLAVFRMWRGEKLMSALGGVFGVVAAGGVSAMTGSANDFFLIGIWASFAGAVITLLSLLVRRPLTGVIWNAMHGGTHPWREDRPTLLVHDLATLAVTAVFAGRFIVRQWLYVADSTAGLAIADTVTGFPLTALAAVAVIWAFRRSTKRLVTTPAQD
ncbi:DUF3159 domain-containing protein [Nocardiopsis sp. NPDC058631]|uniref:DUF3159 domain-containing protein n=1 Tax=Nocardiopsis sp. NPDC058631 TaxID=3346566 RepID=UPI00364F8CDF